ncbi:MAG: hypothetical protein FWE19_09670 [Oscillospiraceae bacterium]|nr:hypothetical protein [Oscillospiraceae bacterium]
MDLFRETAIACNINILAVGFSGTLVGLHLSLPIIPVALLVILWSVLNAVVFSLIAHRKLAKINQLMYDCDLESFLAISEGLAKRRTEKTTNTLMLLNLAAAYIFTGNNTAAGRLLYGIDAGRFTRAAQTRLEAQCELIYHNNFFEYYYRFNDLTAAAQALEQMKRILQSSKLSRSARNTYSGFLLRQQHLLNIANGDYDNAEQVFDLAFEKGRHMLDRVSAKYTLGRIYLHQGKTIEAERAFAYAVMHGGSSIFKVSAAQRLNTLGKTVHLPPDKPPVNVFLAAEKAAIIVCCGLVVCVSLIALIGSFAGLL